MRPSNPTPFQRYYDTDINVEIWWDRGAWRTVVGNPGDCKFVKAANLSAALTNNPGWTAATVSNPSSSIYTYTSETSPVIVSTSSQYDWTTHNLTSHLNGIGLSSAQAALVSFRVDINRTPFMSNDYDNRLYIRTSTGGDVFTNVARATAASDDSSTSASDSSFAVAKLFNGISFQSKFWWYNWPGYAQVTLCGFIYDPVVNVTTPAEFYIKKL